MNGKETELATEDKDQRSIRILQSIQNSAWFSQDPKDPTQICLYRREEDSLYVTPTGEHFSTPDFLEAVDFYVDNRDPDSLVNAEMQKPDGFVNVWRINNSDRKVVVEIKNYLVPQILEVAYWLVRNTQKTNLQIKS